MAVPVANDSMKELLIFFVCGLSKCNFSSNVHFLQLSPFWLLDDRGQTVRRFLTVVPLWARVLLRLDDDVDGPLSTSLLLLGICGEFVLVLIHLLFCWGADGPQTLSRGQLVSSAALWADLLCCTMETKDVKCQFNVNRKGLCRYAAMSSANPSTLHRVWMMKWTVLIPALLSEAFFTGGLVLGRTLLKFPSRIQSCCNPSSGVIRLVGSQLKTTEK